MRFPVSRPVDTAASEHNARQQRAKSAVVIIEAWRQHYNHVRPHSSLEYHTPVEFRRRYEFIDQGAILKQ